MNIGMTKAIASQAAKDEIAKVGTGVDNVARTGVNEVKSQLEDNTTQLNVLKPQVQSLASGSPKGAYATVSALTTAFPTGNTNIYVVTADGGWYYWSGSAWIKGGTYQSTGVGDKEVNLSKIDIPYVIDYIKNISYDYLLNKTVIGTVLSHNGSSPATSTVYNFTPTGSISNDGFKVELNKTYTVYIKFRMQGVENIALNTFNVGIGFKNGWQESKLSNTITCIKTDYVSKSVEMYMDIQIPSTWTNTTYQQVCIPYISLTNLGSTTDVSLVKCIVENYVCVENTVNVSQNILSNYTNLKYYPIINLPNKTIADISNNFGIDAIKNRISALENNVSNKNVVTIGDSLTGSFNYPTTLKSLLGSNYNVLNYGIGGETSTTIASRMGGMCMYVNNITIPSTTTPIIIGNSTDGLLTNDNRFNAKPLMQKCIDGTDGGINPVVINGIEGTITYNPNDKNYTFTRTTNGSQVTIIRPTMIITKAMRERKDDYVNVMWLGTNGGYYVYDSSNWDIKDNFRHLVGQYKALINNGNMANYIILGLWLTSTSANALTEKQKAEDELLRAFGRNFLNIRKYLVEYGLSDLGITPTAEDTIAIGFGNIPPSLLRDSVHLTDNAFNIVAQQVYKRGQELGYW